MADFDCHQTLQRWPQVHITGSISLDGRKRRQRQSHHAALTESRNLPTSSLRRLLSPDSNRAAESTCDEAAPVSPAPHCTSAIFVETYCLPCTACCTCQPFPASPRPG